VILLDTNVISELWKKEPNTKVLSWLDRQAIETLFLSSITLAEIRRGIAIMPQGKKQYTYRTKLEKELLPNFAGRVVPFDLNSTITYADLIAIARSKGETISKEDGYIAAIAKSNNFIVATRDITPFKVIELEIINPWNE